MSDCMQHMHESAEGTIVCNIGLLIYAQTLDLFLAAYVHIYTCGSLYLYSMISTPFIYTLLFIL